MVEIIGVVTVVALSWVLAFSMANESDAEKRRCTGRDLLSTPAEEARTTFAVKNAA